MRIFFDGIDLTPFVVLEVDPAEFHREVGALVAEMWADQPVSLRKRVKPVDWRREIERWERSYAGFVQRDA